MLSGIFFLLFSISLFPVCFFCHFKKGIYTVYQLVIIIRQFIKKNIMIRLWKVMFQQQEVFVIMKGTKDSIRFIECEIILLPSLGRILCSADKALIVYLTFWREKQYQISFCVVIKGLRIVECLLLNVERFILDKSTNYFDSFKTSRYFA